MNADEYRNLAGNGKSQLELLFALQLKEAGAPTPVREHRFNPPRRYRFDFAWPEIMLAVELEGGTLSKYKKSRHTTGTGFHNDCQKYNQAALMGWTVLRFDSAMINNLEAITTTLTSLDRLTHRQG